MSATRTLPPQVPQQLTQIRGRFQMKMSCQIGEAMTGLVQKFANNPPLLQKEKADLQMVLRSTFHKVFSHLPGGLEHFADSNSMS